MTKGMLILLYYAVRWSMAGALLGIAAGVLRGLHNRKALPVALLLSCLWIVGFGFWDGSLTHFLRAGDLGGVALYFAIGCGVASAASSLAYLCSCAATRYIKGNAQ